jgi:hypothetical protein
MGRHATTVVVLAIAFSAQPLTETWATMYAPRAIDSSLALRAEPIQSGPPPYRTPDGRRAPGPHAYPGWRGGPGWRGAPAWRGPPGWSGRPYWYGRPWVRRPYYGTIFAGVALGTLITVAAVGYVPPRPHPDLCWYWADPYGNTGYWDYCS